MPLAPVYEGLGASENIANADYHLKKLTIFIQCYNRPTLAKLAIESILRQTNTDFRLVISDNSSNDEMYRLVQAESPALEYRRRVPPLPALDHFNKSASEADTELFCLFHDDDLMEPGYVEAMLDTISQFPNAVAYACNAVTMDDDVIRKGSFFESGDRHVVLDSPRALAGRYFSRYPNGYAPFPCYIYRSSVVKQIPLNPQTGGKYSDVAWLLEIAKHGPIVWDSRELIRYRMHTANDSNIESLGDRLKLLGFLKLNESFVGRSVIDDYRFGLYKRLRRNSSAANQAYSRHRKFMERFLLAYRLKRFFRLDTYAYLNYKLAKFFRRK